jgi:hypothetical protein
VISGNLKENTKSVDGNILYKNPIIKIKNNEIDLNNGWYYLDGKNVRLIQFTSSKIYLILRKYDPIYSDNFLIFKVEDKDIVYRKTVNCCHLGDLDHDGIIEIGGYQLLEAYCNGCDSAYYETSFIYQLDNTITLDTALSMELTIKRFSTFLGFEEIHLENILRCYIIR